MTQSRRQLLRRRLKLGREQGVRVMHSLDSSAHGDTMERLATGSPAAFVDEYLLLEVAESATYGSPRQALVVFHVNLPVGSRAGL